MPAIHTCADEFAFRRSRPYWICFPIILDLTIIIRSLLARNISFSGVILIGTLMRVAINE